LVLDLLIKDQVTIFREGKRLKVNEITINKEIKLKYYIREYICLSLFLTEFLRVILGIWLDLPTMYCWIQAILVVILFVILFSKMKKIDQCLSLIAITSGTLLLLWSNASVQVWIDCVTNFISFGYIIGFLGLMSFPFTEGKYGEAVIGLLASYLKNGRVIYWFICFITSLMTSLMLFSAVPLVYCLTKDIPIPEESKPFFLGTAITRGYSSAIIWSPFSITMLFSLQANGLTWVKYAPFGLLVFGIGMLLCFVYQKNDYKDNKIVINNAQGSILKAFLSILGLLSSFLLLDNFFNINSFEILILLLIIFPFFWSLTTRNLERWWENTKIYIHTDLTKKFSQINVFLALGFFSGAVELSGITEIIQSTVVNIITSLGTWALSFFIPVAIMLSTLTGINGVIVIALLSLVINPASIGVRPELLTSLYALGGALSYSISPFSVVTMSTSNLIGKSNYELAKANISFIAIYLVISVLCLTFLLI